MADYFGGNNISSIERLLHLVIVFLPNYIGSDVLDL